MLEFKNIEKRFDDGTTALRGIDLSISEGEFVVLLGPSGSGKTTFIRTINGIIKPDRGTISIIDEEKFLTDGKSLRKQMGVVFQDFNLVDNLSSINNVLSGLLFSSNRLLSSLFFFDRKQKLQALECLEQVGILDKAYARVSTLSGGQKQRVGIARAIVKKPKLLLADEPVASLDPVIAHDIMSLLRDLSKRFGITVVCSLHQVDLALEFADRIVGLSDGKIMINTKPAKIRIDEIQTMYKGKTKGLTFGVNKKNGKN
mgnify:CR=1 FL=1